jgi:hypothetical protein
VDIEKLNILYDHYKETFSLISISNKLRDKLFIYLLIALSFMFLQINSVKEINDIGLKLAEKYLGVSLSLSPEFISGMFWFITLSLVIKYAQTLVYIEKQYDYIHKLESTIDNEIGNNKVFSREGFSYLNNYPKFSTWVWIIYTIVFPIMLLLILGYKICMEYKVGITTSFIVNAIICSMIYISMILYLIKIHKSNE